MTAMVSERSSNAASRCESACSRSPTPAYATAIANADVYRCVDSVINSSSAPRAFARAPAAP
jgi:hypothetical protein